MCARIARHRGAQRVLGVDLVAERRRMAERHGIETIDGSDPEEVAELVREATDGRGPDAAIDAVGMEAHGSAPVELLHKAIARLPRALAAPLTEKMGIDRLQALKSAIDVVRRGGTVSIIGVYGGAADPLPMMDLFDKGLQLRMGQAHVKRWVPAILPLLTDEDPLGVHDLATHVVPLEAAPSAYAMFQRKEDGAIKVLLRP
jgi:threonine dehydrogenase-like Zn-dependent dehydrogenase